jgi:hypothetical protein
MDVDKTVADNLLETNEGNRPFKNKKIITLKKAWEKGHWKINGDTIKLDKRGKVIDGQNRLKFISDLDIKMTLWFCKGLKRDSQTTMDNVTNRSFADWLTMDGRMYKNASIIAPAIRALVPYYAPENGVNPRIGESLNKYEVTIDDQIEIFEAIEDSIKVASMYAFENKKGNILSPAQTTTMHHVLSVIGGEVATDFMDELCKGVNLTHGSPTWMLRYYLNERKQKENSPLRASYIFALVIKTWNYWVTDKPMPEVELKKGCDFPVPFEVE